MKNQALNRKSPENPLPEKVGSYTASNQPVITVAGTLVCPSTASAFQRLIGGRTNGQIEWKNASGMSLRDIEGSEANEVLESQH